MFKIFFPLALVFLLTFAFSAPKYNVEYDKGIDYFNQKIPQINQSIGMENVSPLLAGIFGNEAINVYFAKNDGSQVLVGMKTIDGKVSLFQENGFEKPTLNVFISQQTFENTINSSNPSKSAIAAIKSGEIKYQPFGIINSIKYGILGFLLNFG